VKNRKEKIINDLRLWLSDKGVVDFINEEKMVANSVDGLVYPTQAIQQNEEEIFEFINYIHNNVNERDIILEIGLGYFGSTHFIFRYFFDMVITIEKDFNRIRTFNDNLHKFYNNKVDIYKSRFIHNKSYEPSSIYKLAKLLDGKKVDMLFIDGFHSYEAILTDFLIYKNFLKPDGYLVFHDYLWPHKDYELKKFIDSLETEYNLHKILHSKEQGIVIARSKEHNEK
jgi:cephalosporin hydroxylase